MEIHSRETEGITQRRKDAKTQSSSTRFLFAPLRETVFFASLLVGRSHLHYVSRLRFVHRMLAVHRGISSKKSRSLKADTTSPICWCLSTSSNFSFAV